jgi:hypothetical protein
MQQDARNGQLRLKKQALQLGAHADCLRGRADSCQSCRDIMDGLIDRVSHRGSSPDAQAGSRRRSSTGRR